MRAVRRLGWVALMMGLTLAVGPLGASAQSKKAASDSEVSDLETRVKAIEKKLDLQQKESSAESKSIGDRVSAIEGEVKSTKDSLAEMLGIKMHAFVASSYNYNFNTPDSNVNTLEVFQPQANTFQLDQFNLNLSRNKEDENLGFVVNLDFGKVAEVVGGATHWSNNPNSSESTNSIELREAFITYKIPVGDTGIKLKAGKFVTLLGAEIIENWDNHNANVSRSISFGYGIPFTNTGLMATVPVGDMVSFDLSVVNGWDNPADNNDGKSFMGGVGITPADTLSFYISGIYGPEQNNNGHSDRAATTTVVTFKPADMVTLQGEFTYGSEEDAKPTIPTDTAEWYGGAGYLIVQATDDLSVALRGEVFDDVDGSRFCGTYDSTTGSCSGIQAPDGATVWAVTPTLTYKVTEGLLWRSEYRHDNADKKIFQHNSNLNNGQDLVFTQLIYSF